MQVNAPAVLHIATHGFFLDDAIVSAATARSRGLFIRSDRPGDISPPEFRVEDPLLRSGLALAGANRRSGGGYKSNDRLLPRLESWCRPGRSLASDATQDAVERELQTSILLGELYSIRRAGKYGWEKIIR